MNWPAPDPALKRMYHALFGWGRVEPFSKYRSGTLFYPEQAVEWFTAAPPFHSKRDRVEINEPVFIRDRSELKEVYDPADRDHLLNIALQVKRFPSPTEADTERERVSGSEGTSEASGPGASPNGTPETRGPEGETPNTSTPH